MANELNEVNNKVENVSENIAHGISHEEVANLLDKVPSAGSKPSTADLPSLEIDGVKGKENAKQLSKDKDEANSVADSGKDKDAIKNIKEGINVIKDKDFGSIKEGKDKDGLSSIKEGVKEGANVIKDKDGMLSGTEAGKDKEALKNIKEGINVIKGKDGINSVEDLIKDKGNIKNLKDFLKGSFKEANGKEMIKESMKDANGKEMIKESVKEANGKEMIKESMKDANGKEMIKESVKEANGKEMIKESVKDANGKEMIKESVKDANGKEMIKESVKDANGKEMIKESVKDGVKQVAEGVKEAAEKAVKKFDATTFNAENAKLAASGVAADIARDGKVSPQTVEALQKYYRLAGETAGENGQAQFMRNLQRALQDRDLFPLHVAGQPNEQGITNHRVVITNPNGTQVGEVNFSSGGRRRK